MPHRPSAEPASGPDAPDPLGGAAAFQLYDLVTGDEDARLCRDISDDACRDQPGNFLLQVVSLSFSKIGDGLADAKIVLPWLLGALGAPGFFIGLLVPLRESLSLFPQLLIGGVIRRFAVRKWFWAAGSLVEGLAVLAMAGLALAGLAGSAAGWAVLGLLALFSLARGVCSIAAKDTLGKTVSKSRRGRASGLADSIAGVAAGLVGLYLLLTPQGERSDAALLVMLAAAGLCWLLGAAAFALIREQPGATSGGTDLVSVLRGQLRLLLQDPELRKFLVARTLMLATALMSPLLVTLAQRQSEGRLGTLGLLIVASGVAGALSSMIWGGAADRSSRRTMALGAGLAGLLGLVVLLALLAGPAWLDGLWLYAGALFVLGVAHAGVRIGRKTHLVDMAGSEQRSQYVALSNTLIGVMLMAVGAAVGGLMAVSLPGALALLSVLALAGAAVALAMREAQQD